MKNQEFLLEKVGSLLKSEHDVLCQTLSLENFNIPLGGLIRTRLLLALCKTVYPGPDCWAARIPRFALIIEMIHLATLFHDDVIDESCLRRGTPTLRLIAGNKNSVLAGDSILLRSLSLGLEAGVLQELLNRLHETVRGEIMSGIPASPPISIENYERCVAGKTGSIFLLMLDFLSADKDISVPDKIYRCVALIAEMFQIHDDMHDFFGEHIGFGSGKPYGLDSQNQCANYVMSFVSTNYPSFFPEPAPLRSLLANRSLLERLLQDVHRRQSILMDSIADFPELRRFALDFEDKLSVYAIFEEAADGES